MDPVSAQHHAFWRVVGRETPLRCASHILPGKGFPLFLTTLGMSQRVRGDGVGIDARCHSQMSSRGLTAGSNANC